MLDKKKTIVIFSCFYEPFMSGAERFVKEVAERLKGSRSFVVVTAKLRHDLSDEEDFGGYKIVRVGKGDKWDKIRYIWLAPRAAKKYNPQIIHAVMESYAGLALWRANKVLLGVKRILTLQSGDLDKKIWSKIPYLWKKIHTSPDYVTAISNFLAARAKRLGSKNVQVVPNGADLKITEEISAGSSNKEKNGHRIICMARLSWEKDHKNLIAAMPKILEKYSDAELILAGEGQLRENIKYQISNLKLENKIKLLGNLAHEKALEELAKSDVSICPSLAEGLGITFIESQAAGVPVIGTRVGGITDVIEDGKTGLLIEPGKSEAIAEAIIKVFEMNSDARLQMIKNAQESAAKKFNWDNIAEAVGDIYKKIEKPSILICTGIYPPDIGGPATYSNLIQTELNKRGHQAVVLTYGDEKCRMQNTEYRIIGRKHNLLMRYFLYFWKVLQLGKNADIIYVQDPVSVGLPAALANLFLKKKMILKIVGDYAWEQAMQITNYELLITNLDNFYPFNKNHSFKIKLLQKIQTWVAKRADKIITPSFYLKEMLMQGWRVDEKNIRVVYNGFDGIRINLSQGIKNLGKPFKILSVGRLVPWKGFDALIEVIKDIPNVELEIVGDGPLLENLKFKILNFKLEDRIRLSGKLSHDEVVQKMCSSDLFILNSGYEGLSHVILEAMACGLPVAVSWAGGNSELICEAPFFGRKEDAYKNEINGYLFDYNNKEQIKEKINYIIAHPEEAKERAKKAREYVTGLSKEKMIEKLEEVLKV